MTSTSPPRNQSKPKEFRARLLSHVMVADGAMGTVLYSKGIFINRCFDELNLSMPALIKEIPQGYMKAGAEILETNTFGANSFRLGAHGLVEKLRDINLAGAKLARQCAGEQLANRSRFPGTGRADYLEVLCLIEGGDVAACQRELAGGYPFQSLGLAPPLRALDENHAALEELAGEKRLRLFARAAQIM